VVSRVNVGANGAVEVTDNFDLMTCTEIRNFTWDDKEAVEEDEGGFVEVKVEANDYSSISNHEEAVEEVSEVGVDEVGVIMDEHTVEVGREVRDGVKEGCPGKVEEERGEGITLENAIR
jgi:hypothetical protein